MANDEGVVAVALGNTEVTMQGQIPRFREQSCLEHVLAESVEGDAMSVVNSIDQFCRAGAWMMNVGDKKGDALDEIVKLQVAKLGRPVRFLELGTYCGYSATRFGRLLPAGSTLLTFELRPIIAAIATKIIEHAGLSSKVIQVPGTLDTHLHKLGSDTFDFVFIDHWKDSYKKDLIRLESSGCMQAGTMVIADNCKIPGAPKYVEYMRGNANYNVRVLESILEYTDEVDHVYISVVKETASFLLHHGKSRL